MQLICGKGSLKFCILAIGAQAHASVFQGAKRFAQRFFERATNGHDFAYGFHAGGQGVVGTLEFLEREAGDFYHAVVNGGLKARGRCFGDSVCYFVKRVANSKLSCEFGNGEARCLRCQRRRTAHARVHFNGNHAAGFRIHGKLHV